MTRPTIEQLKTERWKPGECVFDMPSQAVRTVLKTQVDDGGDWFYLVDAPDDPTGDGAFPNGWRNGYEIGPPDEPMPLDY